MMTTGNIKANLIKDFNNNIPIIVLAKIFCIILDKHTIDSSARILSNIINNLFGDLFLFLIALPSFLFLSFLLALTNGNSDNILTIFIYYILIYIQDFVPFQ